MSDIKRISVQIIIGVGVLFSLGLIANEWHRRKLLSEADNAYQSKKYKAALISASRAERLKIFSKPKINDVMQNASSAMMKRCSASLLKELNKGKIPNIKGQLDNLKKTLKPFFSQQRIENEMKNLSKVLGASAVTCLLKNYSNSIPNELGNGKWPDMKNSISEFEKAVAPFLAKRDIKSRASELRSIIRAHAIEMAEKASRRGDINELARYLVAAKQVGYEKGRMESELLNALGSKLADKARNGDRDKYFAVLTQLQQRLPKEKHTSNLLADLNELSETSKTRRGIKVPPQGRLQDIFRDAGYIVFTPSAKEKVAEFTVSSNVRHSNRRSYGGGIGRIPSIHTYSSETRYDAIATMTGTIKNAEKCVLSTFTVEGTRSPAPQSLSVLITKNRGVEIGRSVTPTQTDIDRRAKSNLLPILEKKLIQVLSKDIELNPKIKPKPAYRVR